MFRTRSRGTMRGMNAALAAGPDGAGALPHSSRRQLVMALVLTVAVVAAAVFVIRYLLTGPHHYAGVIQQGKAARMNFSSPGRIAAIRVQPGQRVKAGQLLAEQDSAAAAAAVEAAQSVLAEDRAKVAYLQSPKLPAAQAEQAQLKVQEAQSAVTGDQTAVRDAQAALDAATNSAGVAADSATNQLVADQQRFAVACPHGVGAPPASGAPPGAVQVYVTCQNLAGQLTKDHNDIATAQATGAAAVQLARQQLDGAQATLADDQAALASAQNQAATQSAALTSPSALADARAAVASAQSQLAAAKAALAATSIKAPSDGVVAEVAAVEGEFADSSGVHNYPGPQTHLNQGSPNYTLFPPPASPGGYPAQVPEYPVITFYPDNGLQILVEVPQSAVHSLSPGTTVKGAIRAADTTVTGTVDYTVPVPVRQSSGVSYQVLITLERIPPNVLPGMSVSVSR